MPSVPPDAPFVRLVDVYGSDSTNVTEALKKCHNTIELPQFHREMLLRNILYGSLPYTAGYTPAVTRDEILKLTHLVACAG